MKVVLDPGMVTDGAVARLRVGDEWRVDLVFVPTAPRPVEHRADVGMWPIARVGHDPTPQYYLVGHLHRFDHDDSGHGLVALEAPDALFALSVSTAVPDSDDVHGDGFVRVDPWQFDPSRDSPFRRTGTIEGILRHRAPARAGADGRFLADWSRGESERVEQILPHLDFPLRRKFTGFYEVAIHLDAPRAALEGTG